MTPRTWALNKAEHHMFRTTGFISDAQVSLIARAFQSEHARSVRIVKQAARMENVLDTDTNEYLAGYQHAVSDILAALQRGRG